MQPHITYGIEVWGGARKVDLNSILLIQKMAIANTYDNIQYVHDKVRTII